MKVKINEQQRQQLIKLLLKLSRYDVGRLQAISREQFGRKTNTLNSIFKQGKCSYREIKNLAFKQLVKSGACNPVDISLKDGVYLIVSDSHGKHTSRGMFRLLNVLNNYFHFTSIVHVGHILDDDNDISYLWKDFDNLIVVARQQQAKQIEIHKQDFGYSVVTGSVSVGDLRVYNQQFVKDYSKTGLNVVDSYIYSTNCIFGGHKQELISCGSLHNSIYYLMTGCLCDPHITTTVKQIDFKDGKQVKQSYPSTFQVYRSRRHLLNYWEQGVVILQVKNGITTSHPIRIKKVNNQYVTSFYDSIFTENKITIPDKKIFFNSDMHVDKHDELAIELQQQFIKKYNPDIYINLGDLLNNKALNHHEMEKGCFIETSFLKQFFAYCKIVKRMNNWAKEKHLIFGNHQRFMNDFSNKYPQLKDLFYFLYTSPIEQFQFNLHELKSVIQIDGVKFLHGDLKIYGQSGNYLQKISKTFGKDTIVGHLHVNEIKRGCYIVGLSGKYDQQYNDVNGSRWQQGFGFTNYYNGVGFTQLISINKNYNFLINGKIYSPKIKDDQQTRVQLCVR